ncbi:hypothetical protein ACLMJK_005458 [Lecanora helva]
MQMDSSKDSSGSMMPMSSMKMTFFTSTKTPLFSDSWTPSSTGSYVGSCIFLIIFGAIFQALLASRASWQRKMRGIELNRRVIVVDDSGKRNDVTATGTSVRPWRLRTEIPRAAVDTVIAGVAYLLYDRSSGPLNLL